MKNVELYGRVRYAVQIEGLSERAAARRFGIDPRTVSKMMKFSVPPGYVRKKPPARPKLDPFIPVMFTHTLFGFYLGLMVWGGLWLRDRSLRALIPFRR